MSVAKYWPLLGYLCLGAGGGYLVKSRQVFARDDRNFGVELLNEVPSRAAQLAKLRKCTADKPFDVLIVGGGATGTGCALDAATRGLRTALVEREDYASGTSSKSTKLVHGGVRYLEKAVFNLDYGQLKLVYEALHERKVFLDNAPHLTRALPIITPCYHWWEVPYYWAGLKAYDLVAGFKNLIPSKLMFAEEAAQSLPTLARTRNDGTKLKGAVMYYDGQFDDARVNVSLATTAAVAGAATVNYMECTGVLKNLEGQVIGVHCKDRLSGEEVDVYARVVVNATGPFVDRLRKQSSPDSAPLIQPSSGAHVTLPEYLGSCVNGMIIPKTKDGRVMFMLPWLGSLIVGTTDEACKVEDEPRPSEQEIDFILESINDYLNIKVTRADVTSAWSGIRPLAIDTSKQDTQSVSRDHVILTDADGLITVSGGKWTTYRLMAQDVVDAAVKSGRLPLNTGPCVTHTVPLVGGAKYSNNVVAELMRSQRGGMAPAVDLDIATAQHLAHAYGDRAMAVLTLAADRNLGKKLAKGHPFLEAEVVWCCRHEYCMTPQDFIARRTRLAFLDTQACRAALPRVVELMAAEHGWDSARSRRELEAAAALLAACFSAPL